MSRKTGEMGRPVESHLKAATLLPGEVGDLCRLLPMIRARERITAPSSEMESKERQALRTHPAAELGRLVR